MEKTEIINNFAGLGITSPQSLFNYVTTNKEITFQNKKYNLKESNECMEFMALFLEKSDYEVIRLFLTKGNKKYSHFALAFKANEKWYYYEPIIKELKGKYSFTDLNTLYAFLITNIDKIYKETSKTKNHKCILKEIKPLKTLNKKENIKESEDGIEIFVEKKEEYLPKDYLEDKKIKEKIKNKNKSTFPYFILSFIITLILALALLFLAIKYLFK